MKKCKKNLFSSVYDEYLIYAKRQQKEQSYYTLTYNFNKHILPFFKNYYLEDITSKDIMKWEDYILNLNFSNNYNKGLYYLLSGFLSFCSIYYNFNKSIISNVGCFKKKYEKDKSDFYTLKEFNYFIKYVDNNMYKQFFNFLFFTGTRPGEAMALKFSDLKDGYVVIDKTISSHRKREIGTPKTLSSNRTIVIDLKLQKDLLNLKKEYQNKYEVNDDFYIFGGIKPISSTTINRYKKKACEKANIREITLHQFRHSHITLLMDNHITAKEVSKRVGHSKLSTTLDIYTHTSIEQEKRVYNTLNSMRYNFLQKAHQAFKNVISILKH